MNNKQVFQSILGEHYKELFALPDYAMAASRYTPEAMAAKFTDGIIDGTANHDGEGIKRTCKSLGLRHTRKAIVAWCEVAA